MNIVIHTIEFLVYQGILTLEDHNDTPLINKTNRDDPILLVKFGFPDDHLKSLRLDTLRWSNFMYFTKIEYLDAIYNFLSYIRHFLHYQIMLF